MRVYNIQYRENNNVHIQTVKAKDLEHAKQVVMFKNALRPSQVLPDEAIV